MLVVGVDVAALAAFGIALVVVSCIIAAAIPLTQEQGDAAVSATAVTALLMVIAYIIIVRILDMMVGALGW